MKEFRAIGRSRYQLQELSFPLKTLRFIKFFYKKINIHNNKEIGLDWVGVGLNRKRSSSNVKIFLKITLKFSRLQKFLPVFEKKNEIQQKNNMVL